MDYRPALQPGSQIRCARCGRLHSLIKPYDVGTDYTRAMLFVDCPRFSAYRGQGFMIFTANGLVANGAVVVVPPKEWHTESPPERVPGPAGLPQ